jgi:hypothetical protein
VFATRREQAAAGRDLPLVTEAWERPHVNLNCPVVRLVAIHRPSGENVGCRWSKALSKRTLGVPTSIQMSRLPNREEHQFEKQGPLLLLEGQELTAGMP